MTTHPQRAEILIRRSGLEYWRLKYGDGLISELPFSATGKMEIMYKRLPHRIFLYGTLKSGQPNFHFIANPKIGSSRFISNGVTEVPYPLVIATQWNLPFLLYAPGSGQQVQGEIYEIDDNMLNWADQFEGHPDIYIREQVKIVTTSNKDESDSKENRQQTDCWVYFLKNFPQEMLQKKSYSNYDAYSDKSIAYKPDKDLNGPPNIYQALQKDCSDHNNSIVY